MNQKRSTIHKKSKQNYIGSYSLIKKERFLDASIYEQDDHILKVIRKTFRPDNAYTKFDFQNGRPQKSAILTTSSITMAKRYYQTIKAMTKDPDCLKKEFADQPIRKGRMIEVPEFPRLAITYSLQENDKNASGNQAEMKEIIQDYNDYYNTVWHERKLSLKNLVNKLTL